VAKIDELFTRLDAGVEALKQVRAQLRAYRQAVLRDAFEGKLTAEWRESHKGEMEPASVLLQRIKGNRQKNAKGKVKELPPVDTADLPELPKEWVWARVGEIGQVETGTTPPKLKVEYYGKDYFFYKPTDLNAGYYTRYSEDGLTAKGIMEARLLPERSILVTCIGATIGKTGFIRREGASNQQINAIIPEKSILPEYIYFICASPQFQKSILEHASATTLPILSKRKFEILLFPLPPLPEQHKIVEEIERRFSVADEIEKTVEQSLRQAQRLHQSILKRAFEGKLVPQDPTDEPAEKLLERIKAEKASRELQTKPTRKAHRGTTVMQRRLI
jgi:type I restriction enzyme S subunit